MSRSEKTVRRPRILGRGIRRPLVFLALLWISFLLLCDAQGLPLRRSTAAERWLKAEGTAEGVLEGRLTDLKENASGSFSLTISDAGFQPDGREEVLAAGTVLAYFPKVSALSLGNRVAVKGELAFFEEADNPGEFDARAYYLAEDIACRLNGSALMVTDGGTERFRETVRRVRRFLAEGLEKVYDAEESAILKAMLLGDKNAMSEETEALYERAGLSHLFSVSGLHIGFWAMLFGKLAGAFFSLFPFGRGRRRLSRGGFAFLRGAAASLGVIFTVLLCGSRIPVRRAGLMALLAETGRGLRLSADFPSALAAAALWVLIPCPYALFQSSFQLSFGGVMLLGCLLPFLSRKLFLETALSKAFLTPVVLQLGMLPFSLWHFYTFHIWSIPANLLVLPLAGAVLSAGLLSALLAQLFLPAGLIAAGGVHTLLRIAGELCRLVQRLPMHSLVLGRPGVWQMGIYFLLAAFGMLLAVLARRKEQSRLSERIAAAGKSPVRRGLREAGKTVPLLFLWLLACGTVFGVRAGGPLSITSLYVGQGDSHVLRLPGGHAYLIDGGSSYKNAAERSLPAFLKASGIRHLQAIAVSHCDSDHISALDEVMRDGGIRTEKLLIPRAWAASPKTAVLTETAREAGIPVFYTAAGDGWTDGKVRFTVLYPGPSAEEEPDNEASMVLRLDYGGFCALFTGDLGSAGEHVLIREYGAALSDTDYLKIGHHGSRYGSSAAFLKLTGPRIAVISCGRGNLYGHPAPETAERILEAGAGLFRTDLCGAVTVSVKEDGSAAVSAVHTVKEEPMNKDQEKQADRSTWISCAVILAIGLAALCLALWVPKKDGEPSASGESVKERESTRPPESTAFTLPPRPSEAAGSWPISPPSRTEEESVPLRDTEANAGRKASGEDPRMPGYFFDEALTDRLYVLFASDITNNTREEDPFRGLSPDFKERLGSFSERFAGGGWEAEELKAAAEGLSFVWPNDAFKLEHPIGSLNAACYVYPGRDMSLIKERILLTNRMGRHYLFVRVYYSGEADTVRVYMVNAMIY